ncbi:MAG: GGDEF domain-containing response regulator [Candidatus Xenobia bacterium]
MAPQESSGEPTARRLEFTPEIPSTDLGTLPAPSIDGAEQQEEGVSRILIVDDDADCRTIVQMGLELRHYEVAQAANGVEALQMVSEKPPDLIILDVMMPRMDGLEVCRRLRSDFKTSTIPIIMLTARAEVEARVQGLQQGADDYLAKPFDMRELTARVDMLLRRTRQSLQASPLTGLPGNLALQQKVESAITSGQLFAVLYLDLDNFKAYNDRYGHFAGDAVIKATARLISEIVREKGSDSDFVSHIGGDDFMALTSVESAEDVADTICKSFDALIRDFYDPEDRERGHIESVDRRGNKQLFPLMTISLVIVTNEMRAIEHHGQLSQIAAELKKFAKSQDGSKWVKDRRRS